MLTEICNEAVSDVTISRHELKLLNALHSQVVTLIWGNAIVAQGGGSSSVLKGFDRHRRAVQAPDTPHLDIDAAHLQCSLLHLDD